ncbi:MAG: DUF4430 domain-containing protein [Tissierellia bacterium]|nr:DUF4430 domain-containing protein [Tissierellia bacterium]
MNRKIIAILIVLALAVAGTFGYKKFIVPKGVEGEKEVTIQVINSNENVDESFTYNTDHEYLIELLEEKQEELGVSFQEYDFGKMVTGMMDYVVDEGNNEYFHIYVNGEDATTGPGEIPLNDKDTYTFELKTY